MELQYDQKSRFPYIVGPPLNLCSVLPGNLGCVLISSCSLWPPVASTMLSVGAVISPGVPVIVAHEREGRSYALGYLFEPPTVRTLAFKTLSKSPRTDTRPKPPIQFYIPRHDDPFAHSTLHDDEVIPCIQDFEHVLILGSIAGDVDFCLRECTRRHMLFQNPQWRTRFVFAFHAHILGLVHSRLQHWFVMAYRGLAQIQLGEAAATEVELDKITDAVEMCFDRAADVYEGEEDAQRAVEAAFGYGVARMMIQLRDRLDSYEEEVTCKCCTDICE